MQTQDGRQKHKAKPPNAGRGGGWAFTKEVVRSCLQPVSACTCLVDGGQCDLECRGQPRRGVVQQQHVGRVVRKPNLLWGRLLPGSHVEHCKGSGGGWMGGEAHTHTHRSRGGGGQSTPGLPCPAPTTQSLHYRLPCVDANRFMGAGNGRRQIDSVLQGCAINLVSNFLQTPPPNKHHHQWSMCIHTMGNAVLLSVSGSQRLEGCARGTAEGTSHKRAINAHLGKHTTPPRQARGSPTMSCACYKCNEQSCPRAPGLTHHSRCCKARGMAVGTEISAHGLPRSTTATQPQVAPQAPLGCDHHPHVPRPCPTPARTQYRSSW